MPSFRIVRSLHKQQRNDRKQKKFEPISVLRENNDYEIKKLLILGNACKTNNQKTS